MKILIVEDEIRIREGLKKLIQKMCIEHEIVGEAENGKEGLNLIYKIKPNLVITDIRMPVMDGLEMIDEAQKNKCHFKTIILSAYSEFSYAQQAIKLGVTDYLIKPIGVGDLTRVLQSVTTQYELESVSSPQVLGTLENILSGILIGNMTVTEELKRYLANKNGIIEGEPLSEMMLYLGKNYEERSDKTMRNLKYLLDSREGLNYCLVPISKEKTIIVVLYNYNDDQLERWFRSELFMTENLVIPKGTSGAWATFDSPIYLKKYYQILSQYIDWNITVGNEVMVSYPKITKIQAVPCVYPLDIENSMKVAICSGDLAKATKLFDAFLKYFKKGSVYDPKEVKESYVRFLWSIFNIVKELNNQMAKEYNQQSLLESITSSKNYEELFEALEQFKQWVIKESASSEITPGLTVLRARSLINEFYQSGITLDEIAGKLNVTPEYLGTQFHRELGVNFSQYIRERRIKKAKGLLIGTHLKLYEIARQVGYTDPKYFSRVFKEATGLLPTKYRQANK
jgi:two-component system response regulator YesN